MLLPRFPSQPTGMHSPSTQIRRPSSSQEVPSTTWMLSCSTFYIPLIHYASKTLHGLTFFIDILKPFWHGDNRTSLLWAYSWARTFLGLSSRESNRSTFAQTALGWTSHTAPPCIQGYCADWSDILLDPFPGPTWSPWRLLDKVGGCRLQISWWLLRTT